MLWSTEDRTWEMALLRSRDGEKQKIVLALVVSLFVTFTRASRQENIRPRMTITSRVESWARCGFLRITGFYRLGTN
jgi:hypothetical protein